MRNIAIGKFLPAILKPTYLLNLNGAIFVAWLLVCVVLLLPAGTGWADPGEEFLTAVRSRDFTTLHRLVNSGGVDVNQPLEDGKTALMVAAKHGEGDLVLALLAQGAEVNAVNENGGTALMFAAIKADMETVQALVAHDAEVNIRGNFGWTAIMVAAAKGHHEMIRLLLERGADVNARDVYGWTPLIRAVYEHRMEAVEVLLESDATDIDSGDDQGATALHHAAAQGYEEIARLLIEHGADAVTQDLHGRTPMMAAEYAHHPGVVSMIKRELAKRRNAGAVE